MKKLRILGLVISLALSSSAVQATVIPFGLQSNVSQATLDSWGWTEIHRSGGFTTTSEAAIVAAATGNYLMMGIWNTSTQRYEILGAGETSAVTAITYQSYFSDDNGNYNPNWSNGLNFYRTATNGSWGFTTSNTTQLNSADILLANGINNFNGNTEGILARGLSFHTSNGNLFSGWAFNVTGHDHTSFTGSHERVFFTANVPAAAASVPEGGATVALLGLTMSGMALVRRKILN